MHTYVALLRGINLGAHRRVAMADLRALLGGLGYGDVATHLRSGNAVFTAEGTDPDAVARHIRDAVDAELGLDVPTVVRTAEQLGAAVDANPLSVPDPAKFLVLFCSGTVDTDGLAALTPSPQEHVAVVGDQVYTHHEQGIRHAKVPDLVAGYVDGTVTGRNWRTVLRLREMAGG